jgi:hypothetical protein
VLVQERALVESIAGSPAYTAAHYAIVAVS